MDIKRGCLHEARYKNTPDPQPSLFRPRNYPTGYLAYCMGCGALLYHMDYETGVVTPMDEVYERLYTRKGRLKYLAELMKEKGEEIPNVWALEVQLKR